MHIYENSDINTPQNFNSVKLKIDIKNSNSNNDNWETLAPKPSDVGGWRVEEEFIEAIKNNEKISHTTFADGVKYMQFTDALRLSWESGSRVQLPFS